MLSVNILAVQGKVLHQIWSPYYFAYSKLKSRLYLYVMSSSKALSSSSHHADRGPTLAGDYKNDRHRIILHFFEFGLISFKKVIKLFYLVPVQRGSISEKRRICIIQFSWNAHSQITLIWLRCKLLRDISASPHPPKHVFNCFTSAHRSHMGHPVRYICFWSHSVLLQTMCLHHALITCVCPGIACRNVTHLAWSSTGWAHEWTDTTELFCSSPLKQ